MSRSKEEIDKMVALYSSQNDMMQEMISEILNKIPKSRFDELNKVIENKNLYYINNEDECDGIDSLVYMLASFSMSRLAESNLRAIQLKYETE
jgi:hypothetical protein